MSLKHLCRLVVLAIGSWVSLSHAAELRVIPAQPMAEAPKVGYLSPDFLLDTLDGREVRLSDYRGRVVFLNFWATWCGPCRYEMPAMEALYREFRSQGLTVLAVSNDREGARVTGPFRDSLGLTFTIAHDPEMLVGRLYGVRSLPITFIINREGVITHQIFGSRDWNEPEAREEVRRMVMGGLE